MRRLCVICLTLCALTPAATASGPVDAIAAKRALAHAAPLARFHQDAGRLTRVYGAHLAYGNSPAAAGEAFRLGHAEVFGVPAEDLAPERFDGSPDHVQPAMYIPELDDYRFMIVYYRQVRDGVPVFRSDLRLLVHNGGDYPVVLAAASLRDLGDFRPALPAAGAIAPEQVAPGMDAYGPAETVIFAGVDDAPSAPALAITFEAQRGSKADGTFEKWLYVADAQTGEVLYRENRILHVDVAGNVSGTITQDDTSSACAPVETVGLPYARVSIGGSVAFADINGDFVIPNGGSGDVTVNASIRGRWFNVNNTAGGDDAQSQNVTPPGPADFLFDAATEQRRAERDAYFHANVVRDFALAANPSYPIIGTQTDWPVNVNLNDTCNAYYDYSSINFFRSGGGCNNTAFADVVHHEYGHHLVDCAGSGQGAYGEGMGDVQGMILTGRSALGVGFRNCGAGIRNADNSIQYPCSGEGHACGQLISGCIWDTWQELKLSDPAGADTIIRDLQINSMLLHSGSAITPAITVDFLTLDDDDADLNNGTPHETEILIGFGNHNMVPQPPPANDDIENAISVCPGTTYLGDTSWATVDGASSCADSSGSPDVWYAYTPESNGTLTADLCAGAGYDAAMSVHSGSPAHPGNELDCDDDGCGTGGGPSIVSTSVTAGVTYYIRVTGWSGRTGSFALNISGPPCAPDAPLAITLPNGPPEAVAPSTGESFEVSIAAGTESYEPGTAMLHYRYGAGPFSTAPLTDNGGGSFTADLPGGACGETAEFYISAQSDQANTVTAPFDAPASVFSAPVGTLLAALDDNFETDLGWTTASLGATSGHWQRGVPVNDTGWEYDPVADSDGSGQCYLTQNTLGNTDVDNGEVRLISPAIDMTAGNITISYDYYLRLTVADGADWLRVEISSNGDAGPWTLLASHETDGGLTWRSHAIGQSELDGAGVVLTDNMKLRFRAIDAPTASIVEAGVDAFRVTSFSCDAAPCDGDVDGDQDVDVTDLGILLGQFGQSGELSGDLDGSGTVDVSDLGILLAAFGAICS